MTRKPFILVCCLLAIYTMDANAQALVADFTASPTSGCGPLTVAFTDQSGGTPLFWNWDFGNGQTAHTQNPSTVYNVPGLYSVKLRVVNKNGQDSVIKFNLINVSPFPNAIFSSNLTVACAPAGIQFTDHSIPGQGGIAQWLWQFGDGATSNQQNPAHVYSQPGYYTVGLQVTNSQGCSNFVATSRYLRVVPGAQSDFAYAQTSNSCSAPFLLNFTNQTAGPGTLTYAWDFGYSGGTSNQTNPSASFPANTSFTVTLTTQSSLGCSNSIQKTIIFPAANAAITAPDSACANTAVNFSNGSSPAPLSSSWSFGDGNVSTQQNPSNTYSAVASYPVKLVNTYSTCADSVTKTIAIVNSPTANFTSTKTAACTAPFTASFQDASTGAVKWLWDFGDGSTSTQQNPNHTFTSLDSFDVKLTVTNSTGCSNTITKSNFILVTAPSATLNPPQLQGCINTSVFNPVAVVNSVDGVASYSWSAPGGSPATSTSPTPGFTYAIPGTYDLSLTVTTNDGCPSTTLFQKVITVGTPTTPVFTANATPTCRSTPVLFSSASTPADEWVWNFGDGVFAQADTNTIHHFYKNQGSYNVFLTVINNGCSQSTAAPTVIIVKPPIAGFTFTTGCMDKYTVIFNDTSAVDPTQATTYTWDFGDGTSPVTSILPAGTSPLPPQSHTYATLKPYTVTLMVTNATCPDSKSQTVVLDSLTASFSVPPLVCRNAVFTITSTSTSPSLITNYSWQVGALPPASGPDSFYNTALGANGPVVLSLTITDMNGCKFTSQPVSIQVSGPTAKFDTVGPGGCLNSLILFKDQSVIDGTYALKNWIFDFGDDSVIDFPHGAPFTHKYIDTGFFNVKILVQDVNNCSDQFTLDSAVQITSPHAGFFAADTLYCPGVPLPFTDSSRGDNLSWLWDFGNGNSSTVKNPSPTYSTNGQRYTVKLKITDQAGCSDSAMRNGYIHIQSPIAAFSIRDSTSICIPLQTIFTPNPQFYDSLYWDFGDGSTSTLANTTHFYNTYDTFTAKLFLQGAGGCLDSASRRIFVLNPFAVTSMNYSPLKNCDSVLSDFTIIPPGFTRYTLFFGDGAADSSGNTTPSHLFKNPNTYSQLLQLQDSTGCIVDIPGSQQVVVLGSVPFFSIDKHAFCDSSTVNFTDFTFTNDGIAGETWYFGDGQTTMATNPPHDYPNPGVYFPSLTVTTNSGCTETYTDTIKVYQTPHPAFTFTSQPCARAPIQFMGNLTQPDPDAITWAWDFGNGQGSALQDPTVTYAQPGLYTIRLKASIPFGCGDTTSLQIDLHTLPSIKGPAEITIPVGFPTALPFTYSSGIVSYSWTPATNLSCTDCPDPLATPIFATEYKIMVTDSNNCSVTDSILVKTVCNGKNYFIPNTFSPNADGVNDVFYPRGDNLYNVQSMRVFNRWGQLVFEKRDFPANSAPSGWDGTFNGRPAPVDVYAYVIEVVCDNAQVIALNGNVTLVR